MPSQVRDLLSEEIEPVSLEVDTFGGLVLSGLNRIQCGSIHEVLACLDTGRCLIIQRNMFS
jgi:CBS domain containing-hemolysin-like protein